MVLGSVLRPVPYASLVWNIPESEARRRGAEMLYELEIGFKEEGWPSEEFAFSGEYANEQPLREEGFIG